MAAVCLCLTCWLCSCCRWSGYCKKYKEQLSKDPNIDLQAVKRASRTSDAEAALICPVGPVPLLCLCIPLPLCIAAMLHAPLMQKLPSPAQ